MEIIEDRHAKTSLIITSQLPVSKWHEVIGEKTIADANRALDKNIETVFLTGEPKYTSVASTIVRDIIKNHGDASPFLPEEVYKTLKK